MLLSDAIAEQMLDTVITSDVVISLHTADPGSTGANEITGAYRVTIETGEWNAYATVGGAQVVTNANIEEFTDEADAVESVTHFTMCEVDAETFCLSNVLCESKPITTGNVIRIPEGSCTIGRKTSNA